MADIVTDGEIDFEQTVSKSDFYADDGDEWFPEGEETFTLAAGFIVGGSFNFDEAVSTSDFFDDDGDVWFPTGVETFTIPEGFVVSGSFNYNEAVFPSNFYIDGGDEWLPAGDESFATPPGIQTAGFIDFETDEQFAYHAEGMVSAGGRNIDGFVYMMEGGDITAESGIVNNRFSATAPPASLLSGESRDPDTEERLVVTTESGGFASTELDGSYTRFDPEFGSVTMTVTDAYGDPVGGDTVNLDGVTQLSTKSDGTVTADLAGETQVTAARGSVSQTVEVAEGQEESVSFQFGGVEGVVRTPDGDPIGNKEVFIVTEEDEVVDVTTTNEDGEYSFAELPAGQNLYVAARPYYRVADTPGDGGLIARNFPSFVMQLSPGGEEVSEDDLESASVELIDAETGEPIENCDVHFADFDVSTTPEGIARAPIEPDPEADEERIVRASVAQSDSRYEAVDFDVDVDSERAYRAELERHIESTQV